MTGEHYMMTASGEQELDRPGSPSWAEGGNPDPSESECRDPLAVITRRQFEVLRLLAAGWTWAAVAAECGIGRSTIDRHVQNACDRLGVPGAGARGAWEALGWLTVPAEVDTGRFSDD